MGQFDYSKKYKWVQRTADAGIIARDCGYGFEFRGRIWISNGFLVGNNTVRDLVASNDGIDWGVINASTPYGPYAATCPVGDWVYIYDGQIKRTTNGTTFETVASTNNPAFEAEAPMFHVGDKLHIIRTSHVDTFDMTTGAFTTVAHPSISKAGHVRIMFNDRVFIISGAKNGANIPPENGGGYTNMTSLNDVWSTATPEDPASWFKHDTPPWVQRMWPGVVVHAGMLYVTGGYDNFTGGNRNDTWRTVDGEKWERVEVSGLYPGRHAPTMFSRNGRIIMVCGNTNTGTSVQKDVWELIPE